jgi:hypothetical protein
MSASDVAYWNRIRARDAAAQATPQLPNLSQTTAAATRNQRLAENYLNQSARATAQANAAQQQMAGVGQGLYNQYQNQFQPLLSSLLAQANQRPDWLVDRAANDSNLAFDATRRNIDQNMRDLGVNPNSGRWQGMQNRWGMARAAALAGAKTRAHESADATLFSRLMSTYGIGSGLMSQGLNLMGGSAAGYGNAASGFRGLAGDYGSIASGAARTSMNQSVRDGQVAPAAEKSTNQARALSENVVSARQNDPSVSSRATVGSGYFVGPSGDMVGLSNGRVVRGEIDPRHDKLNEIFDI